MTLDSRASILTACIFFPLPAQCVVVAAWCVGKRVYEILPTHPSKRVGFIFHTIGVRASGICGILSEIKIIEEKFHGYSDGK